jgi:predicted metal-binding membrane protein
MSRGTRSGYLAASLPAPAWTLAVAGLLPVVALSWWLSVGRMDGMDAGPSASLGTFGWFVATWLLMMAAMMIPAIAPAVASSFVARSTLLRFVVATGFVAGYLVAWALAGVAVFGVVRAGDAVAGGTFAWHNAGRWVSVAVLAVAAAYQLSSSKGRWLDRCRAESIGSDRNPAQGARSGLAAGGRCLASSWALMLVLFALGAMSLVWMGVVAGLIAAERLSPLVWPARVAAAGVLLAISVGVAAAPASVPGFTVPGSPAAQQAMMHMDGMPAAQNHMRMPGAMARPAANQMPTGRMARPSPGAGHMAP